MLLVEESTIPSALVTKENLMSNMMKTKKKQSRPLLSKGQKGRSSRLSVRGQHTRKGSVDPERATPFLPPIVYTAPKTRGGTPWQRNVTRERTAYSVLSLRDEKKRSRNIQSRFQEIESLQKSVIPQAKTAVPRQRYHQTLKFWKESKQHSRKGRRNKTDKSKEKLAETKMENESSDENLGWSKNFAYLEEIDKTENGFYARQLALRERLIEFETMHYKEAVTRINRYREKLRRPLLSRSKGKAQSLKDKKKDLNEMPSLQVEGEKETKTTETEIPASDPMFRMSPDKEWKPNIQQKMIFNGKVKGLQELGFPAAKKKEENHVPKSRKHHRTLNKIANPRTATVGEQSMTTESRNDQVRNNPAATKENLGITAVGLAQARPSKTSINQESNKKLGTVLGQSDDFTNSTQLNEDRPNTKSSLSTKLRLLLNKSAQKENEEPENEESKGNDTKDNKKKHSYFRNSVSRYQLSNNDRFPSVTRIGSLTTAKGRDGEQKFVMQGISDESARTRLSTSLSNRIMERVKHRNNNDNHELNEGKRPKTQNPNSLQPIENNTHRKTLTLPIPQTAGETTINGIAIARLNTQQTMGHSEFHRNKATTNEVIKKSRSLQRAMKSHRKALKQQRVLKVAFVESANAAENKQSALRELREKEISGQHMLVDPQQLAITSLTAAILNSEVLLRAPSSSPVDFLKGHHVFQPIQKNKGMGIDAQNQGGVSNYFMDTSHPLQEKQDGTLVNQADGLSPINKPFEFLRSSNTDTLMPSVSDLVDLKGLYEAMKLHRPQGLKATTSSLGSLQILQRQHLDRILLKKQPFYYNPFHNQRPTVIATDPSVPLYVVTAAKAVHKPDEKRFPRPNQSQTQENNITEGRNHEKKIFHNSPFPEYGNSTGGRSATVFKDYQTTGYSGIRGVTVSTSTHPIPVADKGK